MTMAHACRARRTLNPGRNGSAAVALAMLTASKLWLIINCQCLCLHLHADLDGASANDSQHCCFLHLAHLQLPKIWGCNSCCCTKGCSTVNSSCSNVWVGCRRSFATTKFAKSASSSSERPCNTTSRRIIRKNNLGRAMGLPRRFGSTCMCVTKKFTLRRRAARTLVKHFLIPITFSNVATIGCWASLRHEMMYGQLCPHRKICMDCAHHAFVRSTKSNNQQSSIRKADIRL